MEALELLRNDLIACQMGTLQGDYEMQSEVLGMLGTLI